MVEKYGTFPAKILRYLSIRTKLDSQIYWHLVSISNYSSWSWKYEGNEQTITSQPYMEI